MFEPFCFEGPERNRRRRPSLFQLIFRRREKDTTCGGMVWCKYCPKTFFSLTLSRGSTEENEGWVLLPPNISHLFACVCKGAATATIFRGFLLLLPFGFLARRTTTTTTRLVTHQLGPWPLSGDALKGFPATECGHWGLWPPTEFRVCCSPSFFYVAYFYRPLNVCVCVCS